MKRRFRIKRLREQLLEPPSKSIIILATAFWSAYITATSSCSRAAVVGDYDADIIVEDCVLVEIKTAPQYDKRDEAQLLNELKVTGIKLGLLVNFGQK